MSITPDDTGVKVMELTPLCPGCGLVVEVREGLADGKTMYHKSCFKSMYPEAYNFRYPGKVPMSDIDRFLEWLQEKTAIYQREAKYLYTVNSDWDRGYSLGEVHTFEYVLKKYKETHP